jgi:hypothetical protein
VKQLLLRVPENLRPRFYNTWAYVSGPRRALILALIWVADLFFIAAFHTNPPLFWLGIGIMLLCNLSSDKGR